MRILKYMYYLEQDMDLIKMDTTADSLFSKQQVSFPYIS